MKSKIVLGTVQFGLDYGINNLIGRLSEEQVFGILDLALRVGIKELDTADGYGDAVNILKKYLIKNPRSFDLMSKFTDGGEKEFLNIFNESLVRLGVPYLAVYYFHKFSDFLAFQQFDKIRLLKKSGKLNLIGVSIYSNDELEVAVESPELDVIQLPFNVLDRSARKIELLKKAKSQNKRVYARSVFLQGLFFMDPVRLPVKLRPLSEPLLRVRQLASENGMSLHELCLNYVMHKNYIDRVLIGVDSDRHLIENMNSIHANFSDSVARSIENIDVPDVGLLDPRGWN